MKEKLSALSIIVIVILFPSSTLAQYVGAAQVQPGRQILIEKKILNPENNKFVDNLNLEQHIFLHEQDITFRVTVTNVVQQDLNNLQITDKLPDVLNFISTSFGDFDKNNKVINIKLDKLKIGESKTFEVKTKVRPEGDLPNTTTCQDNLARVTMGNMVEEDTSRFCVARQVMPATKVMPQTGPSQTLPLLILSALFLAIGLLTKRIIFLED